MHYLPIAVAIAGVWATVNGVLHDIFVIKEHKGPYSRDLLRLLMDGHILITCGIIHLLSYSLVKNNNSAGLYLSLAASVSLLVYCALIFPFLKSLVTISINLVVLVMVLLKLLI